jgi:hypothetical protein
MFVYKVKIDYKEFIFDNSADAISFCVVAKNNAIDPDTRATITLEEKKDAAHLYNETEI